jgi:PIN domain nuclease of toxin-antitoxin system
VRCTPPGTCGCAAIGGAGLRLAPLSRESALEAGLVSRDAVPDPLDRLIVATARQSDALFVTADRRILDYAASRRDLRTHDARK